MENIIIDYEYDEELYFNPQEIKTMQFTYSYYELTLVNGQTYSISTELILKGVYNQITFKKEIIKRINI